MMSHIQKNTKNTQTVGMHIKLYAVMMTNIIKKYRYIEEKMLSIIS